MKRFRWLAVLAAAALMGGALAEPVETEYLVDMSREEVYRLEQRLEALGFLNGESDEIYDASTRQAIESFQQANGLVVSGEADEATLARLNGSDAVTRQDYLRRFADAYAEMASLEKGASGNEVLMLQRRLNEFGYFSGAADGVFGDATRMAVESFQMVNGLPVTGVADGYTLMRLMADSPISWPGFLSEMSATAGDSGLNVYVLQKKLRAMGYFEGDCTGSYGDLTRQAVSAFQENNGLEPTGIADSATWTVIYSGANAANGGAHALQIGDYGEKVQQAQQRLQALGYYTAAVSGQYDLLTETAVRLFQMAEGMDETGELDDEALERLSSERATAISDPEVQRDFEDMLEAADREDQTVMAEAALQLLGASFGAVDDDLYPGFAFVQYVCAQAGLPVIHPETLVALADIPVNAANEAKAGNVIAFQTVEADRVAMRLAICAGEGRIIYCADDGGWIVMSFMDQLDSSNVYRWDAGAGE